MSPTRASIVLLLLYAVSQGGLAAPKIDHWTTDNGVRVHFVPAPEIPILDIRVVFSAGSARDGDQPGLANLTSTILKEGAGDLDADEFSERLGLTGANVTTGAMRDMAWVGLRTMVDPQYAEPALSLMGDVLNRPRFDEVAIERQRARSLVKLEQLHQSPETVAQETFFKAVYGDHPYGSPVLGTKEAITAITPEHIRAFHERYYVARNAVVAIVGAVSPEQAKAIVEQLVKDLPPGDPAPALPPVNALPGPYAAHIDFPSIQSHIQMGQPGIKRGDPDYFPLLVGNHILGGSSMVSILFKEIREKRGLSYGVQSYFSPMAERGPFVASLQTDGSQSEEALSVLTETIGDFIQNGPRADALESAKQNLIGGFPLGLDSNAKIVEYIAMIGFYHLPLDYLATFPSRVGAVTAEDVKNAFNRRLDLTRMVTITVGQTAQADAKDGPPDSGT